MILAKKLRLDRLVNHGSQKMIVLPMDHGFSMGSLPGLDNLPALLDQLKTSPLNGIILHGGMVERLAENIVHLRQANSDIALIIHLNGSSALNPQKNQKVLVCSIEDALRLGADAVSLQVNLGSAQESDMIAQLAEVVQKCRYWGVPVIGMMYPRGDAITNPYDPKLIDNVCRVGAEMGVDVVKTLYPGNIDLFRIIIQACQVPVLVAGGPKMDKELDLLNMIHDACIEAGAAGVAIGRNIFQARDPLGLLRAISKIVHSHYSINEAVKKSGLKVSG